MSLNIGLNMAYRGLQNAESQINVASQNITNANKPGYTRKTFDPNYITTNAGNEIKLIDGAGSAYTYTVLSISICNTHASTNNQFSLWINDTEGGQGLVAGSASSVNSNFYIYKNQSIPAESTFVHNDKIIVADQDELALIPVTDSSALHICVSYLEQTS